LLERGALCVARITGIGFRRLVAAAGPGAVGLGIVLLFNYLGRAALPPSLSPTAALAARLIGSGLIAAATSAIWLRFFVRDGIHGAFAA
jgi:hypothetical protein